MKRKYLIVLVGQSLLILLLLMYSFVQKAAADQQSQVALEQRQKAMEMQRKRIELEIKYQELVKESSRSIH